MKSNNPAKIRNGLLTEARYIHSPNQDPRPLEAEISLIVIHGISLPPGEYGGKAILQLFQNQLDATEHPYFEQIAGLEVSAHILVRRDGEIIQFVPFGERAWHAGKSNYNGCSRCNDFSIGIELEGCDDEPYSNAQYTVLAELIPALRDAYPTISKEALVGHSDIAPGRKTDPGESFDWHRLRADLGDQMNLA